MARSPEEQIGDVEKKIELTEDYIHRLKKRVNALTKRLDHLKEKFGLSKPAAQAAVPEEVPEVVEVPGPESIKTESFASEF
jgi:hypothetical protein